MTGPAWAVPSARLAELRAEREARKLSRDIFDGRIEQVLLDAQRTQHLFRNVVKHGDRVGPLLQFFNAVRLSHTLHADIMANKPATISVPSEYADQRDAITRMRDACLFDSGLHECALTQSIEGYSVLRADRRADGLGVIVVEDNEQCFPVGPLGHDRQPTVWERRWCITHAATRSGERERRYLRIERTRRPAPAGPVVIEQEAYRCESADPLQDASKLRRVPLAEAIPAGLSIPADLVELPVSELPLVQLVNHRYRGKPQLRVGAHNLAIIDQCAAQLSQLARAMSIHGSPKIRVVESMIDEKTGAVKMSIEAVEDPDKQVEYIALEFQFDAMLMFLDRVMAWMIQSMEMSRSLIGMKAGDGANPDTADKLRLESSLALSAANRAIPNMRPAIERIWTVACEISAASMPMAGWPVSPVSVTLYPGIPLDRTEEVRSLREEVDSGFTSIPHAVRQLHGEDKAEQMLEEIEAGQAAQARRQQAALFGSAFGDAPTGNLPTTTEPDAVLSAPEGAAA